MSFEVANVDGLVCEASKSPGVYHNPKRQRGISGNTRKTQNRNPSLTFRVEMAKMRNFKKRAEA